MFCFEAACVLPPAFDFGKMRSLLVPSVHTGVPFVSDPLPTVVPFHGLPPSSRYATATPTPSAVPPFNNPGSPGELPNAEESAHWNITYTSTGRRLEPDGRRHT